MPVTGKMIFRKDHFLNVDWNVPFQIKGGTLRKGLEASLMEDMIISTKLSTALSSSGLSEIFWGMIVLSPTMWVKYVKNIICGVASEWTVDKGWAIWDYGQVIYGFDTVDLR